MSLLSKKCSACEGNVPLLTTEEIQTFLKQVPDWQLVLEGKRIKRDLEVKSFKRGMRFFQKVAEIAEEEGHHPDLHLTEYKKASIELWTHSVGGLTENDFIEAAKIDKAWEEFSVPAKK